MARIYKVKTKNVYLAVVQWFKRQFPEPEYSFDFYWYFSGKKRIWGCFVSKYGHSWACSHQAELDWFIGDLHFPQLPNNYQAITL